MRIAGGWASVCGVWCGRRTMTGECEGGEGVRNGEWCVCPVVAGADGVEGDVAGVDKVFGEIEGADDATKRGACSNLDGEPVYLPKQTGQ